MLKLQIAEFQTTLLHITKAKLDPGVTAGGGKAGIEIERGSLANASLVFDESDDTFKVSTNGGSSFLVSQQALWSNVVEDTTPQLGGDLDINGKNIVSATSNMDIQLVPNGTGVVTVASALKLTDHHSFPASQVQHCCMQTQRQVVVLVCLCRWHK